MSATFSTMKPRGVPFVKGMARVAGSGRKKGTVGVVIGAGVRRGGFKEGHAKVGGRKAGGTNITTRCVREMILEAAAGLGGARRLIEWAMEDERNERLFWSQVWIRLLPLQVQGTGPGGEIELSVKLSAEELTKKLTEMNLPQTIFGGVDKPLLELEAHENGGAVQDRRFLTNGKGDGRCHPRRSR
jgi:hypothetical protein